MLTRDMAESLNHILISTERMMTYEEGLPRRPWFKHQIYAPRFYTGDGVKTLPGTREGIEQRAWEVAEKYVDIVAAALNRVASAIDRAAKWCAKKRRTVARRSTRLRGTLNACPGNGGNG